MLFDLKHNTSNPWFSLFYVECPNVVPFLYASPSQSSHGRWLSMRHLNHSLGEHQDSFIVSSTLRKPLVKLLQFCTNCLSPELGASVLILFRTSVAGCMRELLCYSNHLGTSLVARKASGWVFISRTKQNIEQFPKFYQYREWTRFMSLATTDVWVLGSHSNKMFLEIRIGFTDSFHSKYWAKHELWRSVSCEETIHAVNSVTFSKYAFKHDCFTKWWVLSSCQQFGIYLIY